VTFAHTTQITDAVCVYTLQAFVLRDKTLQYYNKRNHSESKNTFAEDYVLFRNICNIETRLITGSRLLTPGE